MEKLMNIYQKVKRNYSIVYFKRRLYGISLLLFIPLIKEEDFFVNE